MKNILLVKLSSMGDLIQTLAAITDASKAIPGVRFDWVADESFEEIPRWHPSVDQVISVPFRRWKKNIFKSLISGEIRQFIKQIRQKHYDMVIDVQSNLKSAAVTRLCRGLRCGLDRDSVRERGAELAYQKTITVDRDQNHALRMRELLAKILDYPLPETIDYGIDQSRFGPIPFELPNKFIFVTAICSTNLRLWPESFWKYVLEDITKQGYEVLLPWWSPEEEARVERLKNNNPRIHKLPVLNLSGKARILAKAAASLSLDTGLAHMAAALDIPNLSLYGPTSAKSTGTYGNNQVHLSAKGPACAPCLKSKCHYEGASEFKPCLETIKPQHVLHALYALLE